MMAGKFKKANAESVMRAIAGLHVACVEATVTFKLVRDRQAAQAKADAYLQCMRMLKNELGIELVPYSDATKDEKVRYAIARTAIKGE